MYFLFALHNLLPFSLILVEKSLFVDRKMRPILLDDNFGYRISDQQQNPCNSLLVLYHSHYCPYPSIGGRGGLAKHYEKVGVQKDSVLVNGRWK